jgi:hypothetical protein
MLEESMRVSQEENSDEHLFDHFSCENEASLFDFSTRFLYSFRVFIPLALT